MDKKIGIIVLNEEMKQTVVDLYPEEVKNGSIYIELFDTENMENQGVEMSRKGIDALIARSGAYRFAKDSALVPVIRLEMTSIDILKALRKAKMYQREMVVILWDGINFDYSEWEDLVDAKVKVIFFSEPEEIEGIVNLYCDNDREVTILGGAIVTQLAKDRGMNSVFINATADSIREVMKYAHDTVDAIFEEKYRSETFRTILEGVHDAVLTVDTGGVITTCNEQVLKLFGKKWEQAVGHKLENTFPSLMFMMDVLNGSEEMLNQIMTVKNMTVTISASRIYVDNEAVAVVCTLRDITKLQKLEKRIRVELNKKGLVAKYHFEDMTVTDPAMKKILEKAKRIGLDDNTVVLYGESGTGKERIAQGIHNISRRQHEPFVAINCAAISENLLESELFGYEEGAFTGARKGGKPGLFELAHGGTIFLDEINSISKNLQVKLLRVIEEKEVMRLGSDYVIPLDVRIVSAANEDLRTMVEDGSFRSDLFYRLSLLELSIVPLRGRKGDILPLFKQFLDDMEIGEESRPITKEIEDKLIQYDWPGNVRELRNIARRYAIFGEVELGQTKKENAIIDGELDLRTTIDLKEINKIVERKIIEMLSDQGYGKAEIADMLGISRTALWKKMKEEA